MDSAQISRCLPCAGGVPGQKPRPPPHVLSPWRPANMPRNRTPIGRSVSPLYSCPPAGLSKAPSGDPTLGSRSRFTQGAGAFLFTFLRSSNSSCFGVEVHSTGCGRIPSSRS